MIQRPANLFHQEKVEPTDCDCGQRGSVVFTAKTGLKSISKATIFQQKLQSETVWPPLIPPNAQQVLQPPADSDEGAWPTVQTGRNKKKTIDTSAKMSNKVWLQHSDFLLLLYVCLYFYLFLLAGC